MFSLRPYKNTTLVRNMEFGRRASPSTQWQAFDSWAPSHFKSKAFSSACCSTKIGNPRASDGTDFVTNWVSEGTC